MSPRRLDHRLVKIVLLAALLVGAGCDSQQPASTPSPNMQEQGTTAQQAPAGPRPFIAVGTPGDAKVLDPGMTEDTESGQINELLYEGLARFQNGSLVPEPALAEKWETSPDGMVWTFTLRQRVKFHDGTPFNADAVLFSFNRIIDDKHPHHRLGRMPYRDAFYVEVIDKVEKVDDFTVKITLKKPVVSFLANCCTDPMYIVSPTAVEKYGDTFQANPVGTGSFKLTKWTKGVEIQVERFEDYWDHEALPLTSPIIFRVYEEPSQRLNALLVDEVQLITSVDPAHRAIIAKDNALQLFERPALSISYLEMNTSKPPYDNKKFRQALNYAVDKAFIVNDAMQGIGYQSVGAMPPSMEGCLSEQVYPYDPVRAKALLAESGVDLSTFRMKITTYNRPRPYNLIGDRLASIAKQDFEKIGLRVDLEMVDFAKYLDDRVAGSFQIANIGWSSDNGQPDNTLFEVFGKPSNSMRYQNEEANTAMRAAMVEPDAAKRIALWRKANELVVDDAPVVFVNHGKQIMAGRKTLVGFSLHPKGTHFFDGVQDLR